MIEICYRLSRMDQKDTYFLTNAQIIGLSATMMLGAGDGQQAALSSDPIADVDSNVQLYDRTTEGQPSASGELPQYRLAPLVLGRV
jgi:hypothetical protein